jgi:putative ABC transport system substrate-binding protein
VKPTRRHACLYLLGVATAPPISVRAQQSPVPRVGFLSSGSPSAFKSLRGKFLKGLAEQGFVNGRNVYIFDGWAEGDYNKLDELAAEFVKERVAVIAATGGIRSAQAAKRVTDTIPIVAVLGVDPVRLNLVKSLNDPDQNLTGASIITTDLAAKRLGLLYELGPDIEKHVATLLCRFGTTDRKKQ